MEIIESEHWKKKKAYRADIEDYMVEFAINNSRRQRDMHHHDALNAIARIPQTGKRLKVVFRIVGKDKVKLITSYYLD